MEKIRMGVIGLGQRGYYNLNHYLAKYKDVEIRIVCDIYDDRLERAAADVKEQQGIEPICTKNYKEVLNKELVDAVYIATSLRAVTHIQLAAS